MILTISILFRGTNHSIIRLFSRNLVRPLEYFKTAPRSRRSSGNERAPVARLNFRTIVETRVANARLVNLTFRRDGGRAE